jgi:hypothetical protein
VYRVSHSIAICQIHNPDAGGRLRIGVVGGIEQNRDDDRRKRADKWSQIHDPNWFVHFLTWKNALLRTASSLAAQNGMPDKTGILKAAVPDCFGCSTLQIKQK